MSFAQPLLLALLALVPLVFAAWAFGANRAWRRAGSLSRVRPPRPRYGIAVFLAVAAALAIVAAAQPRWGTRDSVIPRTGAQVVFVLDVSRSMAAEDVPPSRIAAARDAITATIDRLGGDRVGLVIFAGDAFLRFPLTTDFAAASRVVESIEPGAIFVEGGSSAASGLDIALAAFDPEVDSGRLIVLVSDGDDLGVDPAGAAGRVAASGVELLVAGAGTAEGGTIPLVDPRSGETTAKPDAQGDAIVTRLNMPFLQALAVAAGGRYLGADLAALPGAVSGRLAALQQASFERQAANLPVERYQWFAGAALVALALASLVELLPRPGRRAALGGAVMALALFAGGCATRAHDVNEDALTAYNAGDYDVAIGLFLEAQAEEPANSAITLNLAAAYHAAGRYEEANRAAGRALDSRNADVRARAFASIGHHRVAMADLPGALDAFRQTLIEDPGDEASRLDYEIVLRLLQPPDPDDGDPTDPGAEATPTPEPGTTPPAGGSPTPGEGNGGEPSATPSPDATPGEGEGEGDGDPGSGEGEGEGGGDGPRTPAELDSAISGIDAAIAELLEETPEELTTIEALEILDLLSERARLAAIRDGLGADGDPGDY